MELMTYMEREGRWASYPSALQGLRLLKASRGRFLLYSDDPMEDVAEMAAFAGLFKTEGGDIERLGAASRFPSECWIRCMRAEGVNRVFYIASPNDPLPCRLRRDDMIEVPEDLCPALHVRRFGGRPLCVCGNRFDLLVLGRRNFMAQCFARWLSCRWNPSAVYEKAAASQ